MLLLAAVISANFFASVSASAADRPNIVFVVADDMGWNDTGYSGNPVVKTPHLDDLAAHGVRFNYFYAAQQMCSPGRFAIMTGRNPFRTGLHQLGAMRPQEVTVAEALKTVGYHTGHFGKWHLGHTDTTPCKQGFDEAVWNLNYFDLGAVLKNERTKESVPLAGDTSVAIMNVALDFIRRHQNDKSPFFVQVCFGSPHQPHQAAEEFKALYKDSPKRSDFLGELSGLDAAVGNLRSELKKLGIAENTLVWFTSDNGGITPQSLDPAGLGKTKVGARTVACLEWPAVVKQPLQTNLVCGHWDMYPTVLEIVGVTMPGQPQLDGISLMPLFRGEKTERERPVGFMLRRRERNGQATPDGEKRAKGGNLRAVDFIADTQGVWIDGKYKLVVSPTDNPASPSIKLVDIYADPAEKTNLAADHPDVVKKMRDALDTWRTQVRASFDGKDYQASK